MRNILISSTRQWNCGDEFIWFGIKRVLEFIGIKANFILFNRHPAINPRPRLWSKKFWKVYLQPAYDNSFFLDQDGLIDYAIFAGTPEWSDGMRVRPMLEYIIRNKIRTSFIGIGAQNKVPFITDLLKEVLNNFTDLIIARDDKTYEAIKKFSNTYKDVCPSLFSAPEDRLKQRSQLNKLGIVIQATNIKWHSIPKEFAEQLFLQYKELEKKYNVEYIAHYIDDLKYAYKLGIAKRTYYSSYAEDYIDIYNKFDFIVSTRVHGCGMASSLGIPSVLIAHDGRADTAKDFLAEVVGPDILLVKLIESIDITQQSKKLIEHRHITFSRYIELFRKHILKIV